LKNKAEEKEEGEEGERTHQLVNRETRTPYIKSTTPLLLASSPPPS